MKYGYRTFNGKTYADKRSKDEISADECSVLIRNCLAVPRDLQPSVREFHNLLTPEGQRGKGLAKKLISMVCDEADVSGVSLLLLVSDDNKKKLIALYESFGFVITQDDEKACVMIRLPNSAEAVA
mgnify:CR=1 FL=1